MKPTHRTWSSTAALLVAIPAASAQAGTIRVFPTATVTGDVVRLSDVAEFDAFSVEEQIKLNAIALMNAPPPGGSLAIPVDRIRAALVEEKTNLAGLRVMGATSCTVRRPAALHLEAVPLNTASASKSMHPQRKPLAGDAAQPESTLRSFLEAAADEEMSRFGGRARLAFDPRDDSVLQLTSPPLRFELVARKGATLGQAQFDVDVFQDVERVQKVSIKSEVSLVRTVLVATRPILKGDIVRPDDVSTEEVTTRTPQDATVADPLLVVGRQSIRFFAQGETLDPTQFTSIPLVARGQLVRVVAAVGGVRLESVGEAMAGGASGEIIRVKMPDREDEYLSGTITGPGEVAVGAVVRVAVNAIADRKEAPRMEARNAPGTLTSKRDH